MTTVQPGVNLLSKTRWLVALGVLLAAIPCNSGRAQNQISSGQNEPQNGASVELPWQARDKFDRVRFMNDASSHFFNSEANPSEKAPRESFLFFPPVAPPLNTEIPILAPLDPGPPAPPQLAAFVGEVFYPMLAARLVSEELPRPMRARIVAYRDKKVGIQNELRARLLALKDADPDTRESQLASLAAQQGPRIAELETLAEKLREDLRKTGAFGLPIETAGQPEAIDRLISSTKETPTDPAGLRRESNALRAAAFFQDGLSLDGRHLLLEAAMEFESPADPLSAAARTDPGTRLISFAPGPSRILLPGKLDSALATRIDDYVSTKDKLKAELKDALHDTVNASAGARRGALEKICEAQSARIAALDAAAEVIRRDLASLPNLGGTPPAPMLPPDLASRIATYRRHKVELLRTLRALLVAPSPAVESVPPGAGIRHEESTAQAWLHNGSSTIEIEPSNLRVSVADFDHLQNDLIATLNKEEAGIRESLADYARATHAPNDRKSVNDLLRDFESARQQQELWDRYKDLQAAVLVPGLSTGQRRILFDAGVEQLGLPLPAGTRID